MLTCVVLSSTPVALSLPRHLAYLNHVSTFEDVEGLHTARINAIRKVKTIGFFFHDPKTAVPEHARVPETGLIYGNFMARTAAGAAMTKAPPNEDLLLAMRKEPIGVIRRAVLHTAQAKAICAVLPRGAYHTEYLLHYFLVKFCGHQYDAQLQLVWQRGNSSFENAMRPALERSVQWALSPVNEAKVRSALASIIR